MLYFCVLWVLLQYLITVLCMLQSLSTNYNKFHLPPHSVTYTQQPYKISIVQSWQTRKGYISKFSLHAHVGRQMYSFFVLLIIRPLQLVIMFLVHCPHVFLKIWQFEKYMVSEFWKGQNSESYFGLQQTC